MKKKKKRKQNFFVGINNPVFVRQQVLNSSKDIIDSLKKYERYEIIKNSKQEYIVELKKVLEEVIVLNRKLRSHMPKERVKASSKAKIHKRIKSAPKAHTNLDILESELDKIESRLETLE